MSGFRLSERAAKATAKTVRKVLTPVDSQPRGDRQRRFAPGTRYCGHLVGNLLAPSDGKAAPTTGQAQCWRPDPESESDPVAMIDDEDLLIEFVNRDSSLEGTSGAFVKIEFINGEWQIYWLGCP